MQTTQNESANKDKRTIKRTKIPFSQFREAFIKSHNVNWDPECGLMYQGRIIQEDDLMGMVLDEMKLMGFINANRIDLEN